jgi:hypothetical protein
MTTFVTVILMLVAPMLPFTVEARLERIAWSTQANTNMLNQIDEKLDKIIQHQSDVEIDKIIMELDRIGRTR